MPVVKSSPSAAVISTQLKQQTLVDTFDLSIKKDKDRLNSILQRVSGGDVSIAEQKQEYDQKRHSWMMYLRYVITTELEDPETKIEGVPLNAGTNNSSN